MQVEIILKEKDNCGGCPMLVCTDLGFICKLACFPKDTPKYLDSESKINRPTICIEKYGE